VQTVLKTRQHVTTCCR